MLLGIYIHDFRVSTYSHSHLSPPLPQPTATALTLLSLTYTLAPPPSPSNLAGAPPRSHHGGAPPPSLPPRRCGSSTKGRLAAHVGWPKEFNGLGLTHPWVGSWVSPFILFWLVIEYIFFYENRRGSRPYWECDRVYGKDMVGSRHYTL